MKPVLLYDAESRLARARVAQWRTATRQEVEYIPYTDSWGTFPESWGRPPQPTHATLFHFIDREGTVFHGAAAVVQLYRCSPDQRWRARAYDRIPVVRRLWDGAYEWMAAHRDASERLHLVLSGRDEDAATYTAPRWLFYRLLGLAFACAFASLWWQLPGLIGSGGIAPVDGSFATLDPAQASQDPAGFASGLGAFPTVFLLTGASDAMLQTAAIGGFIAAILLTAGILPPLAALASWALYLSFVTVGAVFFRLEADLLLLETGFLAIFFAPWQFLPGPYKKSQISPTLVFLYRLLLFRLVFASGLAKAGAAMWDDSTALTQFFISQPLPTLIGWYAHHLPFSLLRWLTWLVVTAELVLPFFVFAPRRLRAYAGMALIALQVFFTFTGNQGFHTLLVIALCVLLFDDGHLRAVLTSGTFRRIAPMPVLPPQPLLKRLLCAGLAIVLIPLGANAFADRFGPPLPGIGPIAAAAQPLRIANAYGRAPRLAAMRPELVIERTRDGYVWEPCAFRWKIDDPERVPPWCQPHLPRLEWLLHDEAFRANAGGATSPWLTAFLNRLQAKDPGVLGLLAPEAEAGDARPVIAVRAERYLYEAASLAARRESGAWWTRIRIAPFAEVRRTAP